MQYGDPLLRGFKFGMLHFLSRLVLELQTIKIENANFLTKMNSFHSLELKYFWLWGHLILAGRHFPPSISRLTPFTLMSWLRTALQIHDTLHDTWHMTHDTWHMTFLTLQWPAPLWSPGTAPAAPWVQSHCHGGSQPGTWAHGENILEYSIIKFSSSVF